MRKHLTPRSTAASLIIFLSVAGLAWAGGSKSGGRVKVIPSETFDAAGVEIVDINRRPHLKYSVTNKSGQSVQAVVVTLTAYDARGNLHSRQTWITRTDLADRTQTSSILAVTAGLKSAARITAEFAGAVIAQEGSACTQGYCDQCTASAEKLCGAGKVKEYSCTVGSTCSCSFTCGNNAN
jgi:hypothetical protein